MTATLIDGWRYTVGRVVKSIDMTITLPDVDPMAIRLAVSFTAQQVVGEVVELEGG